MARLKLDRLVNLNLKSDQILKIPQGEIWKISVYQELNSQFKINNTIPGYEIVQNGFVVEGTEIKRAKGNYGTIQGIAFKVVQ